MKKLVSKIYNIVFKIIGGTFIARSAPAAYFGGFLKSYAKSDFVEIEGRKMFLGDDIFALSINKIWEPRETLTVKKYVKKGDLVIDIGANIGYYTLLFAQLVGPNGKVYAFEPDPINFAVLKKNIEINNYKNVILIQKAVSNSNTMTKLYLSKSHAENRIFDSTSDGMPDYIEIETIKLDEFFKNKNEKINFIKMDVEGTEILIVQGMLDFLHKQDNLKIMTEFYPKLIKKLGVEPAEYLKLVSESGFKIYDINKNIHDDSSKLIKKYTIEKENYTSLLCIKEN